mgnify:CR=1 FL=1
METKDEIRKLRESTGMNRKEFCEYFEIPVRVRSSTRRYTVLSFTEKYFAISLAL